MEQEKNWCENIKEQAEEQIKKIANEGINAGNINYLGEIVDIHKDLANEEYWKVKEENYMRYRESSYGNYDEMYGTRRRDSRGRYMDGGSYNRRGVPGSGRGRYRGHEMLDEMYDNYGNYAEANNSGSYGAKEESKHSLRNMLNSAEDFFAVIMEEAQSPEEIKMVKETARRISEM